MDSITIPLNSINDEVTGLAIGVYDLSLGGLLVTDHKNTDWNGRRLIFDIEKCQTHNTTWSGSGQGRVGFDDAIRYATDSIFLPFDRRAICRTGHESRARQGFTEQPGKLPSKLPTKGRRCPTKRRFLHFPAVCKTSWFIALCDGWPFYAFQKFRKFASPHCLRVEKTLKIHARQRPTHAVHCVNMHILFGMPSQIISNCDKSAT